MNYAAEFLGGLVGAAAVCSLWWFTEWRNRRELRQWYAKRFRGSPLAKLLQDEAARDAMAGAFERAEYGGIGTFYANEERYCIHQQPWIGKPFEQGGTGLFR